MTAILQTSWLIYSWTWARKLKVHDEAKIEANVFGAALALLLKRLRKAWAAGGQHMPLFVLTISLHVTVLILGGEVWFGGTARVVCQQCSSHSGRLLSGGMCFLERLRAFDDGSGRWLHDLHLVFYMQYGSGCIIRRWWIQYFWAFAGSQGAGGFFSLVTSVDFGI